MTLQATDMTGNTFFRFTVIERLPNEKGHVAWLCRCVCGTYRKVLGTNLKRGRHKSCGCLRRDTHNRAGLTHGLSKHPTYKTWESMRTRCQKSNHISFRDYGGRGITVCDRWSKFENFLADMGLRPKGTSIDRIDNDGNYEPGNCRWATQREQLSNRKCTPFLSAFGETKPLIEWFRDSRCSITYAALRKRLKKGMPAEDAISKPVAHYWDLKK